MTSDNLVSFWNALGKFCSFFQQLFDYIISYPPSRRNQLETFLSMLSISITQLVQRSKFSRV